MIATASRSAPLTPRGPPTVAATRPTPPPRRRRHGHPRRPPATPRWDNTKGMTPGRPRGDPRGRRGASKRRHHRDRHWQRRRLPRVATARGPDTRGGGHGHGGNGGRWWETHDQVWLTHGEDGRRRQWKTQAAANKMHGVGPGAGNAAVSECGKGSAALQGTARCSRSLIAR